MKNSTIENSKRSTLLAMTCLFLALGFLPTTTHSQDYRSLSAYVDDFGKNEMFVKKALMDYSVTIVEAQAASRSNAAVGKIVEKLEDINVNLRANNKGWENNTSLRDSFIKMNQKTIACLMNGILILNDYEYQSSLPLAQIQQNLNRKETELISYFEELKNYEKSKKEFGAKYNITFAGTVGKNVLEYHAYENLLFYKMNVLDQKLTATINARDKKEFNDCLNDIDKMHQEVMAKTALYKQNFRDNTLNEANIKYANFIIGQRAKLNVLFSDYVAEYNALQILKNATGPQTPEAVANYNKVVRSYNAKKNLFYESYNAIQSNKKVLYDNFYVVNSTFLKNNGEFENIHAKYAYND